MAARLNDTIARDFRALLGPAGVLDDEASMAPFLVEWRGLYRSRASMVLLPASTEEAAAVVRLCTERGVGIVPQGGNTGLVGGGVARDTPEHPQVLLSARRMNAIRELDPDNYTITAEAGCVLASLQAAAAEADRFFPLSLASEGSCQLGGTLSTNAGGTNVLRYGTARELVLGLEVVLPDGRIFDGLRALRKDNAGYDLKQLFIGAEGTLGLITAATCKLYPRPHGVATAIVSVADPDTAIALHSRARLGLGDELIAFELISRPALAFVLEFLESAREPLDAPAPWYVLLEIATTRDQSAAEEELEEFLAECLDSGLVLTGVAARSGSQRDEFWALRHNVSDAQQLGGASIKNDISVPVSRVGEFIRLATERVEAALPGTRIVAFGHVGDGNIHFNLTQPPGMQAEDFLALWSTLTGEVNAVATALGGSFSAEHGIGLLKVPELKRFRGGVELDLMRTIKKALDPQGIMNPGKILGD
jgi:D-lactate dehydrogenase (cytochrome)